MQDPDLVAIYGSWIPGQLHLSGICCYFDMRSGRADITYQVNTTEVVEVTSYADAPSYLPNTSNCTPWNGPNGDQLESFLPNNGSLWKTALNGTNATTFSTWDDNDLYSPESAETIAGRISYIYTNYHTQFYNTALRDHNMTNSTSQATSYMFDDSWQRWRRAESQLAFFKLFLPQCGCSRPSLSICLTSKT